MIFVSWAQFFVGLLVFYLIFRNDFRAVSPLSDELQIYFPVCYLFLFSLFWVLCVCVCVCVCVWLCWVLVATQELLFTACGH